MLEKIKMYKKYFLRNEIGEMTINDLCSSIQSTIHKYVLERYGRMGEIVWNKCIDKPLSQIDTWIPIWNYVNIIQYCINLRAVRLFFSACSWQKKNCICVKSVEDFGLMQLCDDDAGTAEKASNESDKVKAEKAREGGYILV